MLIVAAQRDLDDLAATGVGNRSTSRHAGVESSCVQVVPGRAVATVSIGTDERK
jgi:hypothetical protein